MGVCKKSAQSHIGMYVFRRKKCGGIGAVVLRPCEFKKLNKDLITIREKEINEVYEIP